MAHHILLTGDSFNWAQISSCNLQEEIEKYQKTPPNRKPTFYMSGFVMDAFCASSSFPSLNWYWDEKYSPVHIYFPDMWEDNFIPQVYELCDLFLESMYFKSFKADAPAFSQCVRELISVYDDRYVGEYFYYIRIWGSNIVPLLPRIVPD